MKRLSWLTLSALLALAACSSDSDKPSASSAAAPSGSTAATTADDGAETTAAAADDGTSDDDGNDDGGAALGDTCTIVTVDEVAAAFGGTVAPGVPNETSGCDFFITGTTKTGDAGIVAFVNIAVNDGSYISFEDEQQVIPDVEKVDGVGNDAWFYDLGMQLHIDVGGGREVVISGILPGDADATQAEVIEFGKVIASKLG